MLAKVKVATSAGKASCSLRPFLVYAFGSGDKGQLGNGRTGEYIITANKVGFDMVHEPGEAVVLSSLGDPN